MAIENIALSRSDIFAIQGDINGEKIADYKIEQDWIESTRSSRVHPR